MAKQKRKPGRPPIAKNKLLSERVVVKMTKPDRRTLEEMARDSELTVGELARAILARSIMGYAASRK